MNFINKFFAIVFVCLILSSLLILSVKSVEVSATSKPSVPAFTVKYVNSFYDIPPSSTTTINQYTGEETTTTTPGRRVDNSTIQLTIKNQPFTPYTNEKGDEINLYYKVQVKGRFGEDKDWSSFADHCIQSASEYTVVSKTANYQAGYQLDFRVQAIIGHLYVSNYDMLEYIFWGIAVYGMTIYESSDWSDVQTFTMPNTSPSESPLQTMTQPEISLTPPYNKPPQIHSQSQPERTPSPQLVFNPFFLLAVSVLVGGVIVAVVLMFTTRYLKNSTTATLS